ncbi:hypothetical protein IM697_34530 [Streptomyces ferrugineus]|uniref:Uncharacterized protein n=1 Tax=Streptomyces ferrugineus TaxID=1413221 RepID=A0A7M2SFS1_9ACTN|nr:hypothetical protein [Streptomyces ferrugineus]QOV35152.1 hypothetical protein IM697_34530 [Streptomyces ferrugineus]
MTTHGRERGGEQVQMQMRGGEGDPVLPGVDEVRASFQGQPDPGFARQRSQQARSARGGLMAAGALVALVCLFVIVGRLNDATQAGVGTVVYGLAFAFAGASVELARRARTRWAMMAIILAAAGASLADAMP